MFGQCLIFACLGLRTIRMLCEQTKTGEDGVLTEYLLIFLNRVRSVLENNKPLSQMALAVMYLVL